MLTRRFGRTDIDIPVLSIGGMRYQHAWKDAPLDEIPAESQANLAATIHAAVQRGLWHIETARGYGSSERQLGLVLPELPRQRLIAQTKVGPRETGDEFRADFDDSMARLQLGYVDLLALHGINNREILERSLRPGGSLEAARALQAAGRCRWVGFSTHAPLDVILDAIESDAFDYVNLHYYWADQRNLPAVEAAARHDMGVFIISPNDKGGLLYRPSAKLVELCAPLHPMQFGDLWCLARPPIHTISLGAARPGDLDPHLEAIERYEELASLLPDIEQRLAAEAERVLGADWMAGWHIGLPEPEDTPGGVALYHTLRLYTLAKAFDMLDYGRMRYNLLGNGGHWFAGMKVGRDAAAALREAVAGSPVAEHIPEALREAHAMLDAEAVKRASEGGE